MLSANDLMGLVCIAVILTGYKTGFKPVTGIWGFVA